MDAFARPTHIARVRVLPRIKKLDDCFGDFLVRVACPCGASRHIEPSRGSPGDRRHSRALPSVCAAQSAA
jgi:hypothetical protein